MWPDTKNQEEFSRSERQPGARCQVPGLRELTLRRDFDFYPETEDFQRVDVYGLITF